MFYIPFFFFLSDAVTNNPVVIKTLEIVVPWFLIEIQFVTATPPSSLLSIIVGPFVVALLNSI
jgi:hypothetical protein